MLLLTVAGPVFAAPSGPTGPSASASRVGPASAARAYRKGPVLLSRSPPERVLRIGGEGTVGQLEWPVAGGFFIFGLGVRGGQYHRGVDIGAPLGTPIRAAASGVVGFAGSRLKGYGALVILIHPDGYITLYAHNRQNLVREGRRVKAGDTIARVGRTGNARSPHLHFELRGRGDTMDPLPLFRTVPRGFRAPVGYRLVAEGETLAHIARAEGVDEGALRQANVHAPRLNALVRLPWHSIEPPSAAGSVESGGNDGLGPVPASETAGETLPRDHAPPAAPPPAGSSAVAPVPVGSSR